MGHQRLGRLPQTKAWRQIIDQIADGANVETVAAAVSAATERSLIAAANDPAVKTAVYLLTRLPLAAREADFVSQLQHLGIDIRTPPSLPALAAAFAESIDRTSRSYAVRNDFGEIAQLCAVECLYAVVGRELPRLFGTEPSDVQNKLAGFATVRQFGVLARDFFARLTRRHLDYYLSRELSAHVGAHRRFRTIREHARFIADLELHCREAARITESFAGEWFSKTNYEGGIDQKAANGFVHYAMKKIHDELRMRRGVDV